VEQITEFLAEYYYNQHHDYKGGCINE